MATQTIQNKVDASILTELQALGTATQISAFATVLGVFTITWNGTPSAVDKNAVLAYFQRNDHMTTT